MAVLTCVEFQFTSSCDGTGPLLATLRHPDGVRRCPLMLVMHGYQGWRGNVAHSAERMARRGYASMALDMRGCGGSAGVPDDGGLEIWDIWDAVQAAGRQFPALVDATQVSIIGYSNGGANVYSSVSRFPYLFRGAMALFGIPSYATFVSLGSHLTPLVHASVGGTPDAVPERYAARDTTLAAGNLRSGTRLHIAYDAKEEGCPPTMQEAYIHAAREAGVRHLQVHVSAESDAQRWIHGHNTGWLDPIEDRFMDMLEADATPAPAMPPVGDLVVLGFLITPRFMCVCGRGDDAVARVHWSFTAEGAELWFSPVDRAGAAAPMRVVFASTTPPLHRVVIDGAPATCPTAASYELTGTTRSTIALSWRR